MDGHLPTSQTRWCTTNFQTHWEHFLARSVRLDAARYCGCCPSCLSSLSPQFPPCTESPTYLSTSTLPSLLPLSPWPTTIPNRRALLSSIPVYALSVTHPLPNYKWTGNTPTRTRSRSMCPSDVYTHMNVGGGGSLLDDQNLEQIAGPCDLLLHAVNRDDALAFSDELTFLR